MGEVYRATDTKLGRDVAVKVVSQTFTYDPERAARFEREAQLLAALNHPHIAGIYGLEQADGSQFLVMELVEGETLAEKLAGGAIAVDDAIRIAGQLADALQAAHDKGIIHRDLKPANIALTTDGQVKVLDFGLAKVVDPSPGADAVNSPTLTLAATQAGVILGTAAYMAPEQAKGKAADKRSDLWAFGCVLYEMLTGRRTFDGDDASDTMAAVLRAEPDWSALPSGVPPAIRLLLRRCLEKDRRARIVDAGAALFLLRELSAPASPSVQPAAAARSSWRRTAAYAVATLVLMAGVAWATRLVLRPETPRVTRFIAGAGPALSISPLNRDLAISPDGARIVYRAGNPSLLYVREMDRLEGTPLPLYNSGLADGLMYYVMPYVRGQSLREYLSERRRLPLDEALRIVKGVADALAFAHRQGIVHRDIKPENVLLQEGHALVADFGIARAASLAGEVELTQTGMIVGTPSYMSPEQTVGDATVDGRSDIYSLACLLFELLSGSPPFTGGGAVDVARRRLTEAAPRLRTTASDVPAAVDEAVAKALAREPRERFATAEEFAAALRGEATAAGSASVAAPAKGLVVLPFGNLSPDPENEFFADGLTEEVIADLSGIRALRVISRTSAMRFKGTDKDLRTIASELNVRYVLEGSVRRAGTSLRVTAQLIEAETDSHVWAEKYSGSIDDVFAIQEEISKKIVKALQVQLTPTEARAVAERPIDNPGAYDCYLRAHHEMFKFTPEALDRAQKLADTGLALIGENPLLLATRGLVSWYYVNFSVRPEERYLDKAASFATRALEQDPEAFLGIFLRGLVAAKRGRLESAVRDMRRAHELKPGDASVPIELARHLFSAGQERSALGKSVFEQVLQVDPLSPLNHVQSAWRLHFGGLPGAEQAVRRSIELSDPDNPARMYAAYSLAIMGRREEAVALLDEVASVLGTTPYGSMSAFFARALQGDAEGAVRHVTPLLEQSARWVEYLALFLSSGYALIGRRDDALGWLRRSVEQGFINYPVLSKDALLESLHGDAEFEALMQQVKQRWQAFEV